MKTDTEYSFIYECPTLNQQVSKDNVYYGNGICSVCGHDDNSTITHAVKAVGRWVRPSFKERMFENKKMKFIRKEDEDKIMNTLKG